VNFEENGGAAGMLHSVVSATFRDPGEIHGGT
jgi:hypothetical protein